MSVQTKFPGTTANVSNGVSGEVVWGSMDNVKADDTSYALLTRSINPTTYYLRSSDDMAMSNFGFTIPSTAYIASIQLTVNGRYTGGGTEGVLHWGAYYGNTERETGTFTLTTSDSDLDVLLDTGLFTNTELNSSSFNIRLWFLEDHSGPVTTQYVYIDHVKVAITYGCSVASFVINTYGIDNSASPGETYDQLITTNLPTTGAVCTWSVVSGSLPSGLSLSSYNNYTGRISGTVGTTTGTYNFTVRATYTCDPTIYDDQAYSITVACSGYYITTSSLTDFTEGTAYSLTLAANPSSGGSSWAILSGALPTDVTLNTSTGEISGTPSDAPAAVTITIKRTWSNACTATKTYAMVYNKNQTTTDQIDNATAVTDSGTIDSAGTSYESAYNNVAYVMNMKNGTWTYINNMPFTSAIYRADDNAMLGTRQDTGGVSKINSGDLFDTEDIQAYFQTGFFDFGDRDELREMAPEFSEALKRARAFFCDVKSNAPLRMTVFTEQNSTGVTFTITPATTDNAVYNTVRTALSRDIRGKYISFKIDNYSISGVTVTYCDFWIGEMALKLKPRGLR